MNRCQVKNVKNNGVSEFIISGSIDESLTHYLDLFTGEQVIIINLDEVISINSIGIREWIKLMNKLESSKIKLTKCPKTFIDQVNMVKGFLPSNATIESFYVPYFSDLTNQEKKILFVNGKQFKEDFINYEKTITEGGIIFQIDVVVSKYFKFIKV